jgi:hypothetical protein
VSSQEVVEAARSLIAELRSRDVTVRALGGVAVALRCPSAGDPILARSYDDLDLITDRTSARRLTAALAELGYGAYERFNALHGHARMMFSGAGGTHLDVLVDAFVMCHRLDLRRRLTIDPETLTVADLLLTKLQIARVNRKDVVDVAALLADHAVTSDETGVNADYVAGLLGGDWGWWRTATENLDLVDQLVPDLGLDGETVARIARRIEELRDRIGAERKTLRWRTRARVGDRVAWRLEPEEVAQ